jgi:hypothetical protein
VLKASRQKHRSRQLRSKEKNGLQKIQMESCRSIKRLKDKRKKKKKKKKKKNRGFRDIRNFVQQNPFRVPYDQTNAAQILRPS